MSDRMPTDITLHQKSHELELQFDDGYHCRLSSEFLRVHSPSAEVQGHGPNQRVLQLNKGDVSILDVQAVGNYAVKLVFSDGHDSGLYSWRYLYELSTHRQQYWSAYLEQVAKHNEANQLGKPAS